MPAYLVLKPCAYTNAEGNAVHHREDGVIADIPDDVAADLGDAVRPMVSGAPALAALAPLPDTKIDGVDQGPARKTPRRD